MAEPSLIPGENDLETLISIQDGYRSMLLLKAAADLDLFTLLTHRGGENGITASDLATISSWDCGRCERLLNALSSIKMVEKVGNGPEGVYKCSSTGRLLASGSSFGMFLKSLPRVDYAFQSLPKQVRTASNSTSEFPEHMTFHKNKDSENHHGNEQHGNGSHHHSKDHCDQGHHHSSKDPSHLISMYRYFSSYGQVHAKRLVTTYNLSSYKTACDLGGGSGIFSYELCRNYPSMAVTLFDVPPTIECVEKNFLPKEENLNIKLMPGDFTETPLPATDLYLLSLILHDWRDEQISSLLHKIHGAINEGGALLIFEKCMTENKTGPTLACLWDMQVMSHCGGRLRSEVEYRQLLLEHGFGDIQVTKSSPHCMYDVIYCKKIN